MAGTFRDYVDDMTILVSGPTPQRAALDLHESLTSVKAALRADNMLLNDSKEQVYGPTAATCRAWEDLTGTPAVAVAKDLGVYHYGHGQSHPTFQAVAQRLRGVAHRIGGLPILRGRKGLIASAIFHGKLLYGQDVHAITQMQFHTLRRLMAAALGPHISRRAPEATLLHHGQGQLDPEVARASRLFKFWIRELPTRAIPEAYWRVCHQERFR